MRNDLLDFVRRELIGPDPVKPHVQDNGEEILINEPPRLRYGAGVLFPSAAPFLAADTSSAAEEDLLDAAASEADIPDDPPAVVLEKNIAVDMAEDYEEEIGLANSFLPSALGFSCFCIVPKDGFEVKVTAGAYQVREHIFQRDDGQTVHRHAYFRMSLDQNFRVAATDVPVLPLSDFNIRLKDQNGAEIPLQLNIRNRTHDNGASGWQLLTFTLINRNSGSKDSISNENCFFQVSLEIKSEEKCFFPYKSAISKADKDDERSNLLLFRNKRTFAVGHGCSPAWDDADTISTGWIRTEAMPTYEIKPIVPAELPGAALKMYELSDRSAHDLSSSLNRLNDAYREWIAEQEKAAESLSPEYSETARQHISSCRDCLSRMEQGVILLGENEQVALAFRLMNRAMLLQQLRYGIETRNWNIEKGQITGLQEAAIPDIDNPATWKSGLGAWRPFQLAFILMNLHAILDPGHADREMVDLIWFPTGGGKTEAYLGLSAYTIFLKRLKDPADSGTTVLMRYTLRLLTAQQFQRAASLICACDMIRKERPEILGTERITIGLWVGGSLTPIYRQDARRIFGKLERGQEDDNPFIVLKCPWCGAQMGYLPEERRNKIRGYKRRRVGEHETIVYQCDNSVCDFSVPEYHLPLLVIDEDIYDQPPTLLIGTVDKFAMLTWRPEARKLFGFRDNRERLTPPELIIQDELHLISGPLGSMVGLFETMIEELCTAELRKPKIIASSATISRAREQINALYGRGTQNVTIFPPQCLDAGESFFAREDQQSPGRIYTGIFASALPSHATAQVRLISSLMQAVKSVPAAEEKQRDPYWTSLIYFNSIRELGHAATLIRADITEYMNAIFSRKGIRGDERRFINRDIELTSRIGSSDIPEYLEQLSKPYTGEKGVYPVDVCLASNMISVGVDIPRLGLMTVIGQPKTTSEYIQATSRVGRSRTGPGLIFMVYNCSKPRDRSHFEQFQGYHSKIYSRVEPTSVTPFSSPARERALHSVMVGLIRFYAENSRQLPRPFPDKDIVERVRNIILDRVSLIDEGEYEATLSQLEAKLRHWKDELPFIYGDFGTPAQMPLMYPAGSMPTEDIRLRAWSTPTSMRNVDSTCDATIINAYINIDER